MVLTDRFSASTIAYQGYGRGLDLAAVTAHKEKTGTVVGAAVGAVTGHLIDKSDGRRC